MKPLDVEVRFGEEVPSWAQGIALLAMEKQLRQLTKLDCRVFKEKMSDDSKLRVKMTPEERERI